MYIRSNALYLIYPDKMCVPCVVNFWNDFLNTENVVELCFGWYVPRSKYFISCCKLFDFCKCLSKYTLRGLNMYILVFKVSSNVFRKLGVRFVQWSKRYILYLVVSHQVYIRGHFFKKKLYVLDAFLDNFFCASVTILEGHASPKFVNLYFKK